MCPTIYPKKTFVELLHRYHSLSFFLNKSCCTYKKMEELLFSKSSYFLCISFAKLPFLQASNFIFPNPKSVKFLSRYNSYEILNFSFSISSRKIYTITPVCLILYKTYKFVFYPVTPL